VMADWCVYQEVLVWYSCSWTLLLKSAHFVCPSYILTDWLALVLILPSRVMLFFNYYTVSW
jgi:hypothetical protein